MSTWDKYEAVYNAIKSDMRDFMVAVATPFGAEVHEDTNNEDYGFLVIIGEDEDQIGLEFQLWDAEAASGDFEAGERGNLHLSATYPDGRIIISYAPHNYTPECFVDYTDVEEFKARVVEMQSMVSDVIAVLSKES